MNCSVVLSSCICLYKAKTPHFGQRTFAKLPDLAHLSRIVKPLALLALFLFCMSASAETYPPAKRGPVVETLHGQEIADPYRWLEEIDSEETRAFVAAQNDVSSAYFESIPQRERIEKRLTELWNYEKIGMPQQVGGRLFYTQNPGLLNQSILYWNDTGAADALPTELLNPNTLSEDGTIALAGWSVSEDGKHLAYGLSEAGSDWTTWHVRSVETGEDLPNETLEWVKFSSAAWLPDSSGFFYGRFEAPKDGEALSEVNENKKLYFHKIGTPQSEDQLVWERPDHPKWSLYASPSEDGRYLILYASEGAGGTNAIFYKDLEAGLDSEAIPLIEHFEGRFGFAGNDDGLFYFLTDYKAPNSRVVAVNTDSPAEENWREILPEIEHPLEDITLFRDEIIAKYMVDVVSRIERFSLLDGAALGAIEMPGVGSVWGFNGKRNDWVTYYYFTGYTTPGTIYRYNLRSHESGIFAEPETGFDSSAYETRQVFYTSKDGTKIPMFITGKKDALAGKTRPTYLYGYGGFNVSLTPSYGTSSATWLEMGGVFAVANLRGGAEYGESWHEAGTKAKKQNVFDDFIAAAEYLIAEGYTTSDQLGIGGGSNGGLLVAACVNQRPDLFGAAIAAVGVLDMLRFHKFTIGWAWTDDYGDPDNADEFPALLEYSPLHNTRNDVPYPPLLIMTGDHDDRVFPAHSFKFGAAAQYAATQFGDESGPILMRIETRAGHGAGKPTAKSIEEAADRWAFLAKELNMDLPDGWGE